MRQMRSQLQINTAARGRGIAPWRWCWDSPVLGRTLVRSSRALVAVALCAAFSAPAQSQSQNHYAGTSITGQLTLTRTVNLLQIQSALRAQAARTATRGPETPRLPSRFSHPHLSRLFAAIAKPSAQSLVVSSAGGGFGFNGISHYDQRLASSGNQFSIEPPNPSLAVANGFVLEGVNNAVRIYTTSGIPLIQTLSSNQVFGLAPAIDRTTGINGVYPTDMRVFYDQDIDRWFVLQRSQDNDALGAPLNSSHIYLAVSQTGDPTGGWNIYVMNTTHSGNPGCPCVPDFPQIGSDQYGFYISANEYDTTFLGLIDTTILGISKAALRVGSMAPTAYRFTLSLSNGYEFAIQPATTPPGASKFLASGGVEYFVSSQAFFSSDSNLAIWALSNTASLQGANPSLLLTQTTVSTLAYIYPSVATQRNGILPYGSSLVPPGQLEYIDGGPDSRVLSVCYAGGRLFATLPAQVTDDAGHSVVGGVYLILSPTFRSGLLAASVIKQGYLSVRNNHVLRPAIAVNAQGRGAITVTLVGPDYFPSTAFTNIDTVSNPTTLQVAGAGALPEDGFTGYFPEPTAPVARWGDYSTAATSTDGSIWMVSEYIPNLPRTQLANWGTFVLQYLP